MENSETNNSTEDVKQTEMEDEAMVDNPEAESEEEAERSRIAR